MQETTINAPEQHWQRFFGQYDSAGTAWHSSVTVYSPDKELLKTYQFISQFQANRDRTVITHTKKSPAPDGSLAETTWKIEKPTCNLPDGVMHPASASRRGLSFGPVCTAWLSKTMEPGQIFSCEILLQHENLRHTVVLVYGKTGELEKIVPIREQIGSFPAPEAEPEINNISGHWVGQKQSMFPDLQLSPFSEITELVLDPTDGKNETFFFPDAMVVTIPKQLQLGEEFALVAGTMVSHDKYQRLTVKYNKLGNFDSLISEVFKAQSWPD
jgi:hypothetical protein